MASHRPSRLVAALLVVAVGVGCHGERQPDASPDGDADADADPLDADESPDADDDPDGDTSADAPEPGPITLVNREVEIVVDRLCDLDGDGLPDNAVADLGAEGAAALAMTLNTFFRAGIDDGDRSLFHMPWIDDLEGPEDAAAVVIFFKGIDVDEPPLLEDDFSGDEPFYVGPGEIDPCGEPRYYVEAAAISPGEVVAELATVLKPAASLPPIQSARLSGAIAPGGSSAELFLCGYASIHDFGAMEGLSEAGDLTMLEILLGGGRPFGIPMIPGITPDLDLDEDGLEQLLVDEDGHIESCIDGDSSVTGGRDCWQAEGMADAFSINLRFVGIAARFAGLQPGWEEEVEGVCEPPPARSLWDAR